MACIADRAFSLHPGSLILTGGSTVRIVVLSIECLPSNVITATVMRELPGRTVGIVASTVLERGMSAPRSLWRRMLRIGPAFFAIVTGRGLMTRALWRLRDGCSEARPFHGTCESSRAMP